MTSQDHSIKTTWKPPQWLLEAAKKRSGVPAPPVDQAFRDKLQYTREHPEEVERRARENAIRSGLDPDAFSRKMAELRKNTPPVQLVQRPKELSVTGMVSETKDLRTDEEIVTFENIQNGESSTYSAQKAVPQTEGIRTPIQEVLSPAPTTTQAQREGTVQDAATRQSQVRKRDGRRERKSKVRLDSRREGTSSASDPASPMDIDDAQPGAESVSMGAMRGASTPDAATSIISTPPNNTSAVGAYPFPSRRTMPTWYTSISAQKLAQLDRKRPQELAAIDALKDCIRRCENETNKSKLNKEHNDLRNHVHKAEIKLVMDSLKVRKTRILTESGLPRIFNENAEFPWDLKADSWNLYERWMNEDFEQDILRGIVTVKGKDRNGDRLDRAYIAKHPRDPKYFGGDGVVLGQWWPSQLCTVRDGVHGAAQGGIYGDKDRGAYSIVLSGGGYHDQDDGDTIEYSGTEGSNFKAKDATLSMITSAKHGNHIRVIRSSQLLKANKYRPSCGLRYDGLYQIKSYKEVDLEKQTYRFHLERVPGQGPIRFEGDAKRPTMFEEEAYDKCKGRI